MGSPRPQPRVGGPSLCDTYVELVAEAQLDLYMGAEVPAYSTPSTEVVPFAADDGAPPCDDVAEETSGTGGGGVDESSGGMQARRQTPSPPWTTPGTWS